MILLLNVSFFGNGKYKMHPKKTGPHLKTSPQTCRNVDSKSLLANKFALKFRDDNLADKVPKRTAPKDPKGHMIQTIEYSTPFFY